MSLAWLNLVALVVAEARIIGWAVRIASGWWHAGVALANLLAVLVVLVALVHEVGRHLDAGATHLKMSNPIGLACFPRIIEISHKCKK